MAPTRMCGEWRVLDWIGGGGNGDVYQCRNSAGLEAVVKILKRAQARRPDRMARFRNEVDFLLTHGQRPGVLSLLDHALPDDPRLPSWYVMPRAVPMTTALGPQPEFRDVVDAMRRVAQTLADLAAEDISHRDLKPDNLFMLDGEWVIGNFGLVCYPEQGHVTRQGRPVGPYYFIAPEMRQHADTADAKAADVYSLGKTLWALGAGRPDPPMGELRRDRAELQISTHVTDTRARLLEPLLESCTADDPLRRPTMQTLADELTWWLEPPLVIPSADLSSFAPQAKRLREANLFEHTHTETDEERLLTAYSDASTQVIGLYESLTGMMAQAGLDFVSPGPKAIEGWPPKDYGGSSNLPSWGISTTASPWIAASLGVVHRSQPETDLEDMAVTVILAIMTPETQQNYLDEFRPFQPGSLEVNQIISELNHKIAEVLPQIVADFLTACQNSGVPRTRSDG